MKLTIHTKNYNVSDRLRDIFEKKVAKLEKYFAEDASCVLVCTKVGIVEKLEVTIIANGHAFRAQEENRSMYSNIDIVLSKIERQVVKNKEKLKAAIKHDAVDEKRLAYMHPRDTAKFIEPEVKKNKAFPIKALTDKEAELELATLDHNFFIYANEKTGGVKVMYRRTDGHVGVIDVTNATTEKKK